MRLVRFTLVIFFWCVGSWAFSLDEFKESHRKLKEHLPLTEGELEEVSKVLQLYVTDTNSVELKSSLVDFLVKSFEVESLTAYAPQVIALVPVIQKLKADLKAFKLEDFSFQDLNRVVALFKMIHSSYKVASEIAAPVVKLKYKPSFTGGMGYVVEVSTTGPFELINLVRDFASLTRNHVGVFDQWITEDYFSFPQVPVFEEDFNQFRFARLIALLEYVSALEKVNPHPGEWNDPLEKLYQEIVAELRFNLRQISGVRLAEANAHAANLWDEVLAKSLFKLTSPHLLIERVLTDAPENSSIQMSLPEIVAEALQILDAVEQQRTTKTGLTSDLVKKANALNSGEIHSYSIIEYLQRHPVMSAKYGRIGRSGAWLGAKSASAAIWLAALPSRTIKNASLTALYGFDRWLGASSKKKRSGKDLRVDLCREAVARAYSEN